MAPTAPGGLPIRPNIESHTPTLWGDGVKDDTPAIRALCNGQPVWHRGRLLYAFIPGGDTK